MKLIPLLVIASTGLGLAQDPPVGRPPADRPDHAGHRPFADSLKRKFGGKNRLDQLSEEDRQRIRKVMEKVWANAEVKAARDNAADAARKYRDTLHKIAVEVDPTIKPLLDKISSELGAPGPPGPPGPFPPDSKGDGRPHPADGERGRFRPGEFMQRALGVPPERMGQLSEDQRGQLRQAMEKISQLPALSAARQALESAAPEGRREAFQNLRKALREALEKEAPELAKALAALRKDDEDGARPDGPRGEDPPRPPGPAGPERRPPPE